MRLQYQILKPIATFDFPDNKSIFISFVDHSKECLAILYASRPHRAVQIPALMLQHYSYHSLDILARKASATSVLQAHMAQTEKLVSNVLLELGRPTLDRQAVATRLHILPRVRNKYTFRMVSRKWWLGCGEVVVVVILATTSTLFLTREVEEVLHLAT